jgi:hypothetical protein
MQALASRCPVQPGCGLTCCCLLPPFCAVLGEPSPSTAAVTPYRLAATPTVGLDSQAAGTGRRWAAGDAMAVEADEVLGASLERHFKAAAFGGDITNKHGGSTVARKPAVAPAAHPAACPASRRSVA